MIIDEYTVHASLITTVKQTLTFDLMKLRPISDAEGRGQGPGFGEELSLTFKQARNK